MMQRERGYFWIALIHLFIHFMCNLMDELYGRTVVLDRAMCVYQIALSIYSCKGKQNDCNAQKKREKEDHDLFFFLMQQKKRLLIWKFSNLDTRLHWLPIKIWLSNLFRIWSAIISDLNPLILIASNSFLLVGKFWKSFRTNMQAKQSKLWLTSLFPAIKWLIEEGQECNYRKVVSRNFKRKEYM